MAGPRRVMYSKHRKVQSAHKPWELKSNRERGSAIAKEVVGGIIAVAAALALVLLFFALGAG